MAIYSELIRLSEKAKKDKNLRVALLTASKDKDPMKSFCDVCLQNGFEIYLGEF